MGKEKDTIKKINYELIPSYTQEQYAKILSFDAEKYGEQNWKKECLGIQSY